MEKSIVQVQCVFSGFILVVLFFEFSLCTAITTAMSKQLYMRATVRQFLNPREKQDETVHRTAKRPKNHKTELDTCKATENKHSKCMLPFGYE